MNKILQTKGYSLIEVMVAVTILMIAIVAPMSIAIKSIQSSRYTLEQNTAIFLAQEAISIIEMQRNDQMVEALVSNSPDAWGWTASFRECESRYGCNFDAQAPYFLGQSNSSIISCSESGENCRLYYNETWNRSNFRVSDTGGGEPSSFIRRVFFDVINNEGVTMRVEVSWDSNFLGQEQKVSISSAFYNHNNTFQ